MKGHGEGEGWKIKVFLKKYKERGEGWDRGQLQNVGQERCRGRGGDGEKLENKMWKRRRHDDMRAEKVERK